MFEALSQKVKVLPFIPALLFQMSGALKSQWRCEFTISLKNKDKIFKMIYSIVFL